MSVQQIIYVAVVLAVLAAIALRQLRWRRLAVSRLWITPVILGALGVSTLFDTGMPTVAALCLLAIQLVLAAATGFGMGRVTSLRTVDADGSPTLEARGGLAAVGLLMVLVVVRVAVTMATAGLSTAGAPSTGAILLMIGVNRVMAAAAITARLNESGAPALP